MDFDDDFFNEFDGDPVVSYSGLDLSGEQGEAENGLDPFNLRNPVSSYLLLSDDVQDELQDPRTRKMKCQLCGHEFMGRKTDHCPICYGMTIREIG